ncbi:MAG: nitroreductase family protein [Actinobacteria bacterium]|nr:nitroreductase family protein [Actinomycetota bacterium]
MPIDPILNRRSIRKFRDENVEPGLIEQVLEAARLAPSWKNLQTWELLVITDAGKRSEVAGTMEGNPARNAITQAPVLIIVCADPTRSGVMNGKEYYMTDIGIVMDHIMLEASSLGLGTVFVGLFDEEKIRGIFGIPGQYRIVAMTPLGYPEKIPEPRPRKGIEEIVHRNNW